MTVLRQIEVEIANGKTTPQACSPTDLLPLEEGIWRPEAGSSETIEGTREGEREAQALGGGAVVGEANSEGRGRGKLLSPERRRGAVRHACENYRVRSGMPAGCWGSGEGHNATRWSIEPTRTR